MQINSPFSNLRRKFFRPALLGTILVAGSVLFVTQPSYADSPTAPNTYCGTLASTVNAGPGNVFITCNLTIPSGMSFNVVPGTTVYVTPGVTITANGSLNASDYNNLGAIAFMTGIPASSGEDPPAASENENPHANHHSNDNNGNDHSTTDKHTKNDNGQAIPVNGTYNLDLNPGSSLFLNQTTVDNAIVTATRSASTLENNKFDNSPLTINTPTSVLIEANTFTQSPIVANSPTNPIIGGNTFSVNSGNPLVINNAANLAGLGSFSDAATTAPESTIAINNSTNLGNWTVFPGAWALSNTTLAPSSITTFLPNTNITINGSFNLSGRLQASRISTDPAITFASAAPSTIQAHPGSLFFSNGATFQNLGLNSQGGSTVVVNSTLDHSPQTVTDPTFGPVYQGSVLNASPLNLFGGQPSLGGNTITSSVPAINVSSAYDISQIGSETFTSGSNPLQTINDSTDKYSSNLPAGTYAINNLTVASTGIFTPIPGSNITVGPQGIIDNGIIQIARNTTDPALNLVSQTPGTPWPLVVNSGATFFARNASFTDVALSANPSPAVFTSVSSNYTNSSITAKNLSVGPDLLSNTLNNTNLTLNNNPTQVVIGNTIFP